MFAPQRVVWSEGMFLSPQHLQSLDRYHEALLSARLGAHVPQSWGVLTLEIDRAALAAGQFRLVRFAGILPDGLPVSFDDGQRGAPAPRSVVEHLAPTARDLKVFLAVPRERDGVSSYADESSVAVAAANMAATGSRFLTTTRNLVDASSPTAQVAVAFARPNAVILFGDEPQEDYTVIPVAEIVRSEAGRLDLDERFIPPAMRVGASAWLVAQLRDLLARFVAKQRELMQRQGRNAAGMELTAIELTRQLQLMALNTSVPGLTWLTDSPDASPTEAYLLLIEMAGRLASFTEGTDPSALPKLAPTNLRATFVELFEVIGRLLAPVARDAVISIGLEPRAGGVHVARLEERVVRGMQLFLGIRTELPEQQVGEQLPRLCKVAAVGEIARLVQTASPGLPVQVTHRPPPELTIRPGIVYFALGMSERIWQTMVNEGTIAVYLPPPFDPTRVKVELLAVPVRAPTTAPGTRVA